MKKHRVTIIIDEEGNPSIDIVNAVGAGCAKDADMWAQLSGGGAKVTKKPEFFQKNPKSEQKNVQTNK